MADKGKKETAIAHPCFIGVDLGGTSITIGAIDNEGRSLAKANIPTMGDKGPQNAVTRVTETIFEVIEKAKLTRDDIAWVGLATPGTMDLKAGMLLCPSNLPSWHYFPIRDRLIEESGFNVVYAHDAAAAAFGEYWQGAGKGESSLVVMTLGTGIGCGIILDGHTLDGAHCHGGECGHILIDTSENARWCNCGQQGHLEAYASATGVIKRTLEMVQAGLNSSLALRVHSVDQKAEIPKIIYEEAINGDKMALKLIDETALYIAYGLVSLVHTVDPSCILLGGAMTFGGKKDPLGRSFIEKIRKEFQARTFKHLAENVRIDYAELGPKAGYIGAGGLARQAWMEANQKKEEEEKENRHHSSRKKKSA